MMGGETPLQQQLFYTDFNLSSRVRNKKQGVKS